MSDLGWRYLSAVDKRTILQGVRDGTAYGGPYHIEIHPTDRCNLGCFFCSTRPRRSGDQLEMGQLRRLIAESAQLDVRSISLSGGGEPLAYPAILELLDEVRRSGIRLATITTNGRGLQPEVRRAIREVRCAQVRVSLNCSNDRDYSEMMRTDGSVFHQVVSNVRELVDDGSSNGGRRPEVIVQFLVYKKNIASIPQMYELAQELGVEGVVFNGLSFLGEELRMNRDETDEMCRLYEKVLEWDEYRRIRGINSFEQNVSERILHIEKRVGRIRAIRGPFRRALRLLRRNDFSAGEKWRHRWRMRRRARIQRMLVTGDDPCIMPWYTATIVADGRVPTCCVLQDAIVGHVQQRSLAEIWHGGEFEKVRHEMRRVMAEGESWRFDAGEYSKVLPMCGIGSKDVDTCPFRSFFYRDDLGFFKRLRFDVARL